MKSVSDSIENSPTSTNNEVNENPSTSSLNRNKEAFVSKIKEYEKLFSDRYTIKNTEYLKRVEKDDADPIIVFPWYSRQNTVAWQRNPENRKWGNYNNQQQFKPRSSQNRYSRTERTNDK